MRKRRSGGSLIGLAAVVLGLVILLSMVLPAGFWWFMLGVGLICGGIWLMRWWC